MMIRYHKQLDRLTPTDVNWTSYGPVTDDSVSYYHGFIRFLDIQEAYMPDRVTRQFWLVQRIPRIVIEPYTCVLVTSLRSYKKFYDDHDGIWCRWQAQRIDPTTLGSSLFGSVSTVADDYMQWYQLYSHVRVLQQIRSVVLPMMYLVRDDNIAMPEGLRVAWLRVHNFLTSGRDAP